MVIGLLLANIVTTSKALVTRSEALVTISVALVSTSLGPGPMGFFSFLVRTDV